MIQGYNKTFKTATQAFENVFATLALHAESTQTIESRDGAVAAEILNACITIEDPTRGIVQSKIRNMPMRYAVGELLWYLSGTNLTRDISLYAKKWQSLSDDGEHANSAYGYRIQQHFGYDQWQYVKEKLLANSEDRQCVIHIKDGHENHKTKDTPCTIALQFMSREGKLHMTTFMRSNDVWYGLPYDVFSFTALQIKMAFELGVEIGTYTHFATSLHLYQRDLDSYKESKNGTKKDTSAG